MKSNKGVTLIALVITIIVLLILAGVSISLVMGDSGVFTQAKDATTKSTKADLKEALDRAVASALGKYTSTTDFSSGRKSFYEWLEGQCSNQGVDNLLTESGYTICCKKGNSQIDVSVSAGDNKKGYNFKITEETGEQKNRLNVKVDYSSDDQNNLQTLNVTKGS